jgi:O-antigen/teichoic acid export membrane protein
LAVVNTYLNVLLIPRYGITGAAMATAISIMSYNLMKLVFIYRHFKMQPFTLNTLKIIALGFIAYGIGFILPLNFHGLINIALRSAVVGTFLLIVVYRLNVSTDFNNIVKNVLKRVNINLPEK